MIVDFPNLGLLAEATVVGIDAHERSFIRGLTLKVIEATRQRNYPIGLVHVTDVYETLRGSHFDVRIADADGAPTGHIARIEITYDHFKRNPG